MIHIDTHVVVWMHRRRTKKISPAAVRAMRSEAVVMSPLVVVELAYMAEIGRLDADPERVQAEMVSEFGIVTSTADFGQICQTAIRQSWTRDPFDRLIVANAIVDGARLITADQTILDNFRDAVW